ncbi:anthranilate phosphoribosyltransferase [Rhizosaccharibacter radicis]|uniref:Anthranilate phosphoribosyltransferase n=1 Tax=Rhizosaccharibacter radicis TaxID=2782605 RepID=A0ABT1VV57_9PROT|nr:anthranilate phosphoribosyltransferase [Acetobacteraceae bacterium KSS12]
MSPAGTTPAGGGSALKPVLARLAAGERLAEHESEVAFGVVMEGAATAAQIAALVMAMRVRGETVAELEGAVRAMRARMRTVPGVADAIDVCGTGGDNHGTLNVSTAVAFVLAALGVPVAKHGNRALSSRAGASDTLEALGVPLHDDPAVLERLLQEQGIAFLSAPLHHPAMRHAAPVRAELGTRTIFNLLGPLCNPAGVRRQMIGLFDARWAEPVVAVLRRLGAERVWAVHGNDALGGSAQGLDELTLAGPSDVVALENGEVHRFTIEPERLGLARRPVSDIWGGDAIGNAEALESLLRGATGAYRETVLLNASAALQVSGKGNMLRTPDGEALHAMLREGMAHAARTLDDGSALAVLERLRAGSDIPREDDVAIGAIHGG